MRVTTTSRFNDLKENKVREVGDTFEVSKERYAEILKVGKFVKEVKEEKTPKKKGD